MENKQVAILKVGKREFDLKLSNEDIQFIVSKYGEDNREYLRTMTSGGWNKNGITKRQLD